jgi:CelD/BcsL family acetyltransferase involved in cellulose biosynthesis
VLAGARERSRVQFHVPTRRRRVRARLAEQARAAERSGWHVEVSRGEQAKGEDVAAFAAAYEQTMHRAQAAERYFFGSEYYRALLSFPRSWLLLARHADGDVGAAAITALSDGILHYFLGGTADSALRASPFKNVVMTMLDLADELRLALNFGGGVRPGDGLERFKRGFANAELPFHTHEVVCDSAAYAELSVGREVSQFFPAYRGG